jgi:glutamate N-acetyltransferase/amino-acid N-acetyltransferase
MCQSFLQTAFRTTFQGDSNMADKMSFVEGGTVTSPQGFKAGATYAGIKTYAEDKLDLGILASERPCTSAGVFTRNRIKSPSVLMTQAQLAKGKLRGVVVNSGVANTMVGEAGMKDAQEAVMLASQHTGLEFDELAICSTGVIGVELPMALIREGIPKIQLSDDGGSAFARSIMTTDTRHKEVAVSFEVDGTSMTLGGCAKGVGMIHPDMATMLCFLATDATVEKAFLQQALKGAVDNSFNMLSVDGDSSTNDTVLLYANGAAGNEPIWSDSPAATVFQGALNAVCVYLTRELARDGEGASRLLHVRVEGALNAEDARNAARTIVSSNLVKTAVHGSDPNWGRIAMALGRSGAEVDESKLALYVNDVCILWDGAAIPFHKESVVALMRGTEVSFRVNMGLGEASADAWGCAMSEEYVTINSAYTT